jgi:hypothetical protein
MHGDRFDAHFAARAQYAQCDLAAIGYDHFIEHRRRPISRAFVGR